MIYVLDQTDEIASGVSYLLLSLSWRRWDPLWRYIMSWLDGYEWDVACRFTVRCRWFYVDILITYFMYRVILFPILYAAFALVGRSVWTGTLFISRISDRSFRFGIQWENSVDIGQVLLDVDVTSHYLLWPENFPSPWHHAISHAVAFKLFSNSKTVTLCFSSLWN
jgi:hypothetical protein